MRLLGSHAAHPLRATAHARPAPGRYAELIRFGMNESVGFLRTGTCRDDAIKLCAADAKTSGNVCEPQ